MKESAWLHYDREYVWHPYTQMQLLPEATGVVSAEGSYLTLADGRRVLDAISSWWVTLHGHANPHVARAIAEQAATLEQVIFAGFTHEPAARLAAGLADIAPAGLEKVFYSDNGSTAVEVALKMCVQYWKHAGEVRTRFLAIEHAYHGDTFGAMSVSASGAFTAPFEPLLFSVTRLPFPEPPEVANAALSDSEEHFLASLEREVLLGDVAGFIYEPLLLGSGGMLTWRAEVLERALQIVRRHHVFAIADEVLTGFGRTGSMFASDRCATKPDLMTLSKGLTGGFLPMGATLTTRDIFNAFLSDDRRRTFFHGHSYTANPLGCAAGLASLAVFRNEPVMERIGTIERTHARLGSGIADRFDLRMRQIGTIVAFEPRQSAGYLSKASLRYSAAALLKNVLLRPLGDVVYFLPPYSTTVSDLEYAYEVLTVALQQEQVTA